MALPADVTRCHGFQCKERHSCLRFTDLYQGVSERTPYMRRSSYLVAGRACRDRLPTAPHGPQVA